MKLKKLFSFATTFVLAITMLTGNVSAVGVESISAFNPSNLQQFYSANNTSETSIGHFTLPTPSNQSSIQNSAASAAVFLGDIGFSDSLSQRWRVGNSYATHTLNCRVSECYVDTNIIPLNFYKNHRGTYNNVVAFQILEDTLFMSAETLYHPSTGMQSNYYDPVLGKETPRRMDYEDVNYVGAFLIAREVSTGQFEVIDVLSDFNPLIAFGWSIVDFG